MSQWYLLEKTYIEYDIMVLRVKSNPAQTVSLSTDIEVSHKTGKMDKSLNFYLALADN